MLFLFGCLALLQITTLPGLLALKWMAFEGTKLQKIVYTFALSLLFNYGIVLLLVIARIYYQPVILIIVLGEIAAALWLYRKELQNPLAQTAQEAWNTSVRQFHEFLIIPGGASSAQQGMGLFSRSAFLGLLVLSLTFIWSMFRIFWSNIGTIFSAWDTINSWNRWATVWASNLFPDDTHYYPQLIPTNWSISYAAMGNIDVQFFAKAIMPLFALLLLAALLDLALSQRKTGHLIALVLMHLLLKKFLGPEITNGYVDVAITFFSFLPIHALLHASTTDNERQRKQLLLLGAFFAAGASVTKQGGLYIFAIYPLLAFISQFRPLKQKLSSPEYLELVKNWALMALIPLSWYATKAVFIQLGYDNAEVDEVIRVSGMAYNNVGYFEQIIAALSRFGPYLALFGFVLVTLPFTKPIYRWLALLVVFPYPILWALFVGYDMRNLSIFVPVFVLTAGNSLEITFEFLALKFEQLAWPKIRQYAILILLVGFMATGGVALSSNFLVEKQKQLAIESFNPEINKLIYEIVAEKGPNTIFITNYPVRNLPGLENNQIRFAFREYPGFITFINDPSIEYLILPGNELDPQIVEYIDQKVAAGDYKVLLTDKHWKKYTVIQIVRR